MAVTTKLRSCQMTTTTLLIILLSIIWHSSAKIVSRDTKLALGHKGRPSPGKHSKTEEFVKKLEYQAAGGMDNFLLGEIVPINLNLLPDSQIAQEIVDGLGEEFAIIDQDLGDDPEALNSFTLPASRKDRQLSLLYQGVYVPDSRFNAFVDGVMVNMVVEMKRKKMDPLYFRVYNRGVVEHVPTRTGKKRDGRNNSMKDGGKEPNLMEASASNNRRKSRQRDRGSAIGGGVVRGLTDVKRFGNAEVQVAGNTTLVRSHFVFGPLNIELIFETENGPKTINSTLSALAAHALTEVKDNNSTRLMEFFIDSFVNSSPADYQISLVGARSRRYRRLSKSAILRLYKQDGRMEKRLAQTLQTAHDKPLPDVTANAEDLSRRRKKINSNKLKNVGINNNNNNNQARSLKIFKKKKMDGKVLRFGDQDNGNLRKMLKARKEEKLSSGHTRSAIQEGILLNMGLEGRDFDRTVRDRFFESDLSIFGD